MPTQVVPHAIDRGGVVLACLLDGLVLLLPDLLDRLRVVVQALLDAVLTELARRGEPLPKVLATGGAAALLEKTLRHPFTLVPDLTLRGLAAAWRLNAPSG